MENEYEDAEEEPHQIRYTRRRTRLSLATNNNSVRLPPNTFQDVPQIDNNLNSASTNSSGPQNVIQNANNNEEINEIPSNSPIVQVRDFRIYIEPLSRLNQHSATIEILHEPDQGQNNLDNINNDVILIEDDIAPIAPTEYAPIESLNVSSSSTAHQPAMEGASSKKRKRSKSSTPKRSSNLNSSILNEDDDDGSVCPICLDHWEMSGSHRLTSLKCGHLFGDSCIRRWLSECPSGTKSCPSCKSRAGNRDLRFIYAKRVRAVDNTEEVRLREQIDSERNKYSKLQTDYELMAFELKTVKTQVSRLESDIERMRRIQDFGTSSNSIDKKPPPYFYDHKMFLSKNIQITQEPGCRVLIYSKFSNNLMVSQKSSQSLFPGYGLKFIDVQQNFRPTTFLHISVKSVRDLSLNLVEDSILCASMEKTAKIFNIHNRTITQSFTPSDKGIWACAMDKEHRPNSIYLGSQTGSTFIMDVRNPNTIVEETSILGDGSPVIKICTVPISDIFPLGGFLVCKLQSLWFYEFLSSQSLNATRLAVEGPFMSIHYDYISSNILISTRNCAKFPMSKYILGKILKLNNVIVFDTEMNLFGSKVTPVMTRCTQIPVKNNSLIAAYIQDAKQLTLWNIGENTKIQSLPCVDVIYDTCPITLNEDRVYMAASTDMKCRIYEVVSTSKF